MPEKATTYMPEDNDLLLELLWDERRDNPVYRHASPFRRRGLRLLEYLFAWALIVAMGFLAFLDSQGFLHSDISELMVIFLFFVYFLVIPALLIDLIVIRTPEQLEVLYLTPLTRQEIVFGSVTPAVIHTCLVVAGAASVFCYWLYTFPDYPFFWAVFAGILFLLVSVNYIAKLLRLLFVFRKMRFLLIVVAPLSLIFDLLVILVGGALCMVPFYKPISGPLLGIIPSLAAPIPVLIWLIWWNTRVAMKWMVGLYYRDFEDASVWNLFMGRMKRREPLP